MNTTTLPPARRSFAARRLAFAALALGLLAAAPAFAYDSIAITGPFAEWNPKGRALAKVEPGMWSAEVELPAGETKFKLTANNAWDVNWGSDGANVAIPCQVSLTQNAGDILLKVPKAGAYRVVFEENPGSGRPRVSIIAADGDFSATGFREGGADMPRYTMVSIAGSFNKWLPGDFPLAYGKDGWREGQVKLPAGLVEFKFPTNDTWELSPSFGGAGEDHFLPQKGYAMLEGRNIRLYVAMEGTYTAKINERTGEFSIEPGPAMTLPAKSEMKEVEFDAMNWPNSALGWDLDADAAMAKSADDPHQWIWTGDLPAGELALKFAANGAWDYAWGEFAQPRDLPAKGIAALDAPDMKVRLPANGRYEVRFNDLSSEWKVSAAPAE